MALMAGSRLEHHQSTAVARRRKRGDDRWQGRAGRGACAAGGSCKNRRDFRKSPRPRWSSLGRADIGFAPSSARAVMLLVGIFLGVVPMLKLLPRIYLVALVSDRAPSF